MNYPAIVRVTKTIEEAEKVKSILFRLEREVKPGQFFMILVPGEDEIPMSVSYATNLEKGITFKVVGRATRKLYEVKEGSVIGVRGPLGNGFSLKGKNILFVGGGTGIASIVLAIERAIKENRKCKVVIGARNEREIIFEERLRRQGAEVYISTDDGSKGFKGKASDLALKLIEEMEPDQVITCGPEKMMKKIVDICNEREIYVEASLERFVKCALGICGQCVMGKGLRICTDGPVFDGKTLAGCADFGVFRRDESGKKVYFHE